jgi:hypothetical protein
MFAVFGQIIVWCLVAWKLCLVLVGLGKVLTLGFLMVSYLYNLTQWLWRYALIKIMVSLELQCLQVLGKS